MQGLFSDNNKGTLAYEATFTSEIRCDAPLNITWNITFDDGDDMRQPISGLNGTGTVLGGTPYLRQEASRMKYILEHAPRIHPYHIDRFMQHFIDNLDTYMANPSALRNSLISVFGVTAADHVFNVFDNESGDWRQPAMSEAMRKLQATKETLDTARIGLLSGQYTGIFKDLDEYHIDEDNEDSWFIGNTSTPSNPATIKSLEQERERVEKETELARAQNALREERRREQREVWSGTGTGAYLRNKVSAFGMIEPFTGIMDLDKKQLDKLREILGNIQDVDVLKKHKRAAVLVKKWITPEEWKELMTEHKVTIYSKLHKNRKFVIHEDPQRKVDVYMKDKLTYTLCGISADPDYADGDKVLNKIISIKTDESHYIKNSNRFDEDD